jgi:tetratricopeptide (TPR) repeat protein
LSEELEGAESAPEGSGAGVDPVAVALALGGASQERADAFLKKQEGLIDDQRKLVGLQAKELAHELELRHWSLLVRHLSSLLKLTLEVSVALLALALVCGVGVMVWNAAHADGLIVESFKVPPDLAEKGLTGEVVATRLLDELSSMQAQSNALRAASSYANNWGDDLKVEIPETGVSLGEVNRYLRGWLGHETHISGEVVRLDSGDIELTVRSGSEAGESVTGSSAEFHTVLHKAAEAVYARTQPYRYTNILAQQGRQQEVEALALAHTQTGPAIERAWARIVLAAQLSNRNRLEEALRTARAAVAIDPDFAFGWYRIGQIGINGEEILTAVKKSLSLVGPGTADLVPDTVAQLQSAAHRIIAVHLGDYDEDVRQSIELFPMIDFFADPAIQFQQAKSATGGGVFVPISEHALIARARIGQHDLSEARQLLAQEPAYMAAFKNRNAAALGVREQILTDRAGQYFRNLEVAVALETGDWGRIKQLVPTLQSGTSSLARSYNAFIYPPVGLWPNLALAEAETGDFAAAHALIDRTPTECDRCLSVHARIDALQKNYGGADFWFAAAVAKSPSLPFAYADWGRSLLERGHADAAIEKFTLANQKGPHFADPLEGWGEALMAKNQSHLALAKFAEAGKYAPNWGRLHLKWGEALVYAGKRDEAKAQFARAAQLDLTPTEKTELARKL